MSFNFRPPPRLTVPVSSSADVDDELLVTLHRHVSEGGTVHVTTPFTNVDQVPVRLRDLAQINSGQENEREVRELLSHRNRAERPHAVRGQVDWSLVGMAAAVAAGTVATVGTGAVIGGYCGGPAGALVGAAVGASAAVTGVGVATAVVGRKLTVSIGTRGLDMTINECSSEDHSRVCVVQ
eukprot:TRINITY_DN26186_c0_g1_i1.p1 TRINITY_DN26186_c0_g1~~TRINITY_DN26186_c0_g1_i1.p1  ORF type:complete len:181 (-),score=30.20 TRINITY_DN26186_c0_g1_i1:256-798(-)